MSLGRRDEIVVAGRRVPVHYENERGSMIIPGSVEKQIVLNFVGRALATPVTALTIIIGSAGRDITVAYQSVVQDIQTGIYEVKARGELDRINCILREFGSEIISIENSHYPDEIKQNYKRVLERRMNERYSQFTN